jgi:hypothetical protein
VNQNDPVLDEIIAERKEVRRREEEVRRTEEHATAYLALLVIEAEEAELQRESQQVDAARVVRDRAEQNYFGKAAAHENKRSSLTFRRNHWYGVLARTMPELVRQELVGIDEGLALARAKAVAPNTDARQAMDNYITKLEEIRDRVLALTAVDPATVSAKLDVIRQAIPSVNPEPVPTKSWMQEQSDGLRNYLASRFRGETI